jgi:VanZ family protein
MVQQTENISQPSPKIRIMWVVVIVAFNVMIIGGILFAGLWPFNFFPENGCEADTKTGTLLFEKTGIAYRKLDVSACQSLFNLSFFSLTFSARPFNAPVYCATIFALYNSDEKILAINQWKTTLIVQYNSDRVVFGNVMEEHALVPVNITITDSMLTVTCSDITKKIFIDNSEIKNSLLQYIVFGNNASLHSSWKGVLSFIRFNKSNDSFNLIQVPRQLVPLKAEMLTPPWNDIRMERGYALDLIINLLGFVPLGFSLCLLLNYVFSIHYYKYLVILLSFLTSLSIEIAQAYLITRTSQLSDLILNSWGGVLGVVFYVIFRRATLESKKSSKIINRRERTKF